jgi:SPP1 gp7 family putative phage head morphogenesis protein
MLTAKSDPTKTLMIRNKASKEIDRRFMSIRKFVRDSIYIGKLVTNVNQRFSLVPIRDYDYLRDNDKIDAFNKDLQEIVNKEILGIEDGSIKPNNYWLDTYIGDAYDKGARKTRVIAERGIYNLAKLPNYSPLLNPAHLERAEFLYTRSFNDMKGVTDTMRSQMSRVLSEGMIKGENPKNVARAMIDRVDSIGINRAKLIARTEIVESHNQASIKEAELLQKETGVVINMIWIGAEDARERATHNQRNNNIYTPDDALLLIGEPNCRCSVSAYIDPDNLKKI